ncbi:MAG TPA: MFS transporter [Clostridiaceae bacterium]
MEMAIDRKKFRIPLFCLVTLMFWFSMYTYVPILAYYVEYLGATHMTAGIIVGSYGFTQMLLRIPVGIMSDRLHKRRLFITFGLFFSLLSGLGLVVTGNLTVILIFRSLAGAAAATWVDFTILFSSYFKHEEATKSIGIISFFSSIGQMFGMLFGGFVANSYGFKAPFIFGVIIGSAGLILSLFLVDKYDENAQKITFKGVVEVIKDHTLLVVSFLAILSQLVTFATVFGFTPLYAATLGASKLQMSILTVFSTLATAIASIYGGGILSKKFGEKKVAVFGFVITGIFTVTIAFTTSLPMLIFTQTIAGFGRGLAFTVLMGLSIRHMPTDKRATAMGFFQSIYGLGMFAGPFIMGAISDKVSQRQGFIFTGIVACITSFLALIMLKRPKENLL